MNNTTAAGSLHGSCLCGAVRYRVDARARHAENCWCSRCRKAHGAAFSTNALVPSSALHIDGEEALSVYRSSARREKLFCRHCGSPLFIRRLNAPELTVVTLGTMDDDPRIRPAREVFVASRAPWCSPGRVLPSYEVYPGAEPAACTEAPVHFAATVGTSLLLVVDMQIGLDEACYGPRHPAHPHPAVAQLLDAWRSAGQAVGYTRHRSSRLGSALSPGAPGTAIHPAVAPANGEPVFDKTTNSAFHHPGFAAAVHALAPDRVVIAGMATDACITATARDAHDRGLPVTVVGDACATFDRRSLDGTVLRAGTVHDVALAALAASGIDVREAAQVISTLNR